MTLDKNLCEAFCIDCTIISGAALILKQSLRFGDLTYHETAHQVSVAQKALSRILDLLQNELKNEETSKTAKEVFDTI